MEISDKSPYASIYNLIPGKYQLTFELNETTTETLKFSILDNFQIKPRLLLMSILINDDFQLINKGSILHFNFKLVGIIALDSVDIYIKTYFLKEKSDTLNGVFSGIDSENRLVNGNVFYCAY